MKGIRTILVSLLAATIATLALAGCSAPSPSEHDDTQSGGNSYFINPSTGKITKYTDYLGHVLFDQGHTKHDKLVQNNMLFPPNSAWDSVGVQSSDVVIEGKPYPASGSVGWAVNPNMTDTQKVLFFNQVLANPTTSGQDLSSAYSLSDLIVNAVYNRIHDVKLPAANWQSAGPSTTTVDDQIAAAWKAGTPAWKAYQDKTGTPTTSTNYAYSFLCATYKVNPTNESQILAAAQANIPSDWDVVFTFAGAGATITTETTLPCAVMQQAVQLQAQPGLNPPPGVNNGNNSSDPVPNPFP